MPDDHSFARLLDCIFPAAVDTGQWNSLLRELSACTKAVTAGLKLYDPASHSHQISAGTGLLAPEGTREYVSY